MHWQVRCRARCLNFGLDLYLHPFYVCASSKGSGEVAYMHRQSEHGMIKYSIRIKSRMSWPISLLRNHFLIKSSRSSLFSDQNKLRLLTFNGQHMSFGTYRACVVLSSGAQYLFFLPEPLSALILCLHRLQMPWRGCTHEQAPLSMG